MSLKIEKIDTSKHAIKQRALMEAGIVPHHPAISVFSASQGGGKTTLVANLLTNPLMYGKSIEDYSKKELDKDKSLRPKGYFDAIFLMIGSEDDMYDKLIEDNIIKQNHVCLIPTPADLQKVIDQQKSAIQQANGDISKVPKVLFIFDDVVNDRVLLRSKAFLQCFVAGRHINSSTWLLSQYLNLIPKACRLQANYLFVFRFNRAELQVLSEQYCPANVTKKEFAELCYSAVAEKEDGNKNSFLLIAKRASEDKRFRRNLDSFLTLKRMKYIPKLDKLPKKKEIEDIDFDNEMTIKEINDEIFDLTKTTSKPKFFEPTFQEVKAIPIIAKKGRPKILKRYTKKY